jgi:zinc transport system permease protein
MIGDGLSHVSFGALSIAVALGVAPLVISIPVVVIAAFFLLRIAENSKLKSDAAIALVSSSALAIGIIVTSLTTGMNTDVSSYMFGSILAMDRADVILSIVLSILVLCLFFFCYHKIFAVTFDENFARATGVSVNGFNTLIALLTAITIVVGMRMMGAMLISSLIIFPALTSMRVCVRFRSVIWCSGIISVINFVTGLLLSYLYNLPVGAAVVCVSLVLFLIFSLIGKLKSR